jgi:hypothetical protein
MRKASRGEPSRLARATSEPRLGIFWLFKRTLLIDSIPLSQSEQYSHHRGYPHSHIDVWEKWRRKGTVPMETEYEEFPRGRVVYDIQSQTFTLLADRCILEEKELIARIKRELHLPKDTTLEPDGHYRCFNCLYARDEQA